MFILFRNFVCENIQCAENNWAYKWGPIIEHLQLSVLYDLKLALYTVSNIHPRSKFDWKLSTSSAVKT